MPAICLKPAATWPSFPCLKPPHCHATQIQRDINSLINEALHPKQFCHAKRLPENSGSLLLTASGKPTRNVQYIRLPTALFADTEAAENHTQEVVGVKFASDGIAGVLCQAQVFGEEFELLAAAQGGEFELGLGGFQRAQVSASGEK